jgi:hypothetical protein
MALLAHEVRIYNPVTRSFSTEYYQTGEAGGGIGWRAGDPSTDASTTKLYLDQGVIVVRKAAG